LRDNDGKAVSAFKSGEGINIVFHEMIGKVIGRQGNSYDDANEAEVFL